MPAWSGSGEDPFLCFRLPNSGCVLLQQRSERGSKLTCDSYMATNEGSILITSAILNQLLQRPPPPKTITLWGRFQLTNLRGHKCSVYNTMLSQWSKVTSPVMGEITVVCYLMSCVTWREYTCTIFMPKIHNNQRFIRWWRNTKTSYKITSLIIFKHVEFLKVKERLRSYFKLKRLERHDNYMLCMTLTQTLWLQRT